MRLVADDYNDDFQLTHDTHQQLINLIYFIIRCFHNFIRSIYT